MKPQIYIFSRLAMIVGISAGLCVGVSGCAVDLSNGPSPVKIQTTSAAALMTPERANSEPRPLKSTRQNEVAAVDLSIKRKLLGETIQPAISSRAGKTAQPNKDISDQASTFEQPTGNALYQLESAAQPIDSESLEVFSGAPTTDALAGTLANRQWTGVSRSELRDQAMRYHPALEAARADYRSLQGKHQQSGLPPNPTAGLIADDINEDGGAGRYGVYFGRQIVRGNKLSASQAIVDGELQSAAFGVQEIERRLLTDVDRFYFDVLIAQEQLSLADQMTEISRDALIVSQALLESQEVPRTSVLQAQLQLKKSEIAGRRFRAAHLSAKRKLAALIGQEDLPTATVAGNVGDIIEVADFETTYDRLLRDSPELSRLFADIETRKRQLVRRQLQPISDVTWQTSFLYDFVSDDIIGGFQVGWKIPTLNRNQGAIYQSNQQVIAAEHRAETKALQLRQRLAEAYEGYLDAKLQVEAFENDLLPIATETIQLLTQGYQAGETDALELLSAERLLFQTRLTYLQNLRILGQQTASIEGLMLDDGLGASLNPQN